ncbi:hypothetical protein BKA66DRAFT_568659 [Pyrenochaeta sp. MPI-SDFR-AT-0127]|nr:hypothetical protein BKA66DRAFT_568659 [Pyrenochaeta sp. MPI-SDFR-AT-0127]
MFSFSGTLLAGQHDTQKKRPAPSKPTPITFPLLRPPEPSITTPPICWSEQQAGVSAHFLSLRKPSDVTEETLSLLNVTFQSDCDFETLQSSLSNNAQSHLPPRSWLDSPGSSEPSQHTEPITKLLSNGRRAPEQKDFYVRARELFFKNDDAFSTLTRKGNGTQPPLRLAHFRKFWEGLDNMAYYWDTSLDDYSPSESETTPDDIPTASGTLPHRANAKSQDAITQVKPNFITESDSGFGVIGDDEPRKKMKTEAVGQRVLTQSLDLNLSSHGAVAPYTSPRPPNQVLPARFSSPRSPSVANVEPNPKPSDALNGSYRGYRIGNGAEMPDQYRIDCVRAFLEPITWAFGVTLAQHRRPPVLTLEHVRFPVRMSSVAWRAPQDRTKARQGWLEGPVLGIQCRADVNFGATGKLDAESTLDTVRELGGLLLLAQERAREGLRERPGGAGKWWTMKPRWGGGPGGEVGDATGVNDANLAQNTAKVEEKPTERNRDGSRVRRRPTPAEVWKILKTGNPLWDPKVAYEAIGKDKGTEWDEVYMISSLNHHISLLKLRIHSAYMQYLNDGGLPEDPPSDPSWCSPKLQRTKWFDLFDIDDRIEAMRGIWGIMSYLMRADDSRQENSTMNEA